MLRKTEQSSNMTHHTGEKVKTTYRKLRKILGDPTAYEIDGKIHVYWSFETENGVLGTIYDWKRYTNPREYPDLVMTFNIGSHNNGQIILKAVEDALSKV